MRPLAAACMALLLSAIPPGARAAELSPPKAAALRGLSPLARLPLIPAGRAALAANLQITGTIQMGEARQPLPLFLPEARRQALRDAFVTQGNAAQLADGLGDRLGSAYRASARYTGERAFTSASPTLARLIAYANQVTAADSNIGKYVLANGTADGHAFVPEGAAILAGGMTDALGAAYGHRAGTPGAGPYGNARPFQTEPRLTAFGGADYLGRPSGNRAYLYGPAQDLRASPAFPSGHTTYGTMEAVLLGLLVPERYPQMAARAAEYGNGRILMGAHYAMDVIAGRTLALHDLAHLLANDPGYVGRADMGAPPVGDFQATLRQARGKVRARLARACGGTVAACAAADRGRFGDLGRDAALVETTLGYGLPVVHPDTAGRREDVGKVAPEAGYLLTAAFPGLSLARADAILTETEGPGGGFLDDGSGFGVYSRLNLFEAARVAMRGG